MRIRKMSDTGDYTFGSSLGNYYIDSPVGVAQLVQTSLLLFLNEWFLDTSVGVPYFQSILGKFSKEIADTTLRDQILQVQGVVNIETYESVLDPDDRRLTVSVTLNTLYGPTLVQIQNYTIY